jgi:hypothetical protein
LKCYEGQGQWSITGFWYIVNGARHRKKETSLPATILYMHTAPSTTTPNSGCYWMRLTEWNWPECQDGRRQGSRGARHVSFGEYTQQTIEELSRPTTSYKD